MDFLHSLITGPVLPATVLVAVMVCWSMLGILGALDLELPAGDVDMDLDVDLDLDLDVEVSGQGGGADASATDGFGLLFLRWLNIHEIPLLVWLGIFAITWWTVSIVLWLFLDSALVPGPGWLASSVLVVKNLLISLPLTKLFTGPMRGWFRHEKIGARSLLGQECEISSLEASPESGQVKFKTDGAPLLLNVRTDGPHLARGTRVWITHYDARRRVYIVSPTGTKSE